MSKLVLARHGETIYNRKGLWTGLTDTVLTAKGRQEADVAGAHVSDVVFGAAYHGLLKRSQTTLLRMLQQNDCQRCPAVEGFSALNERDYGIYTGMSKLAVREAVGEAEFVRIRRGWDHPIEDGQTMKGKYEDDIVPFHQSFVTPRLDAGENVIVVSSNNPLRAYVKLLEDVPIGRVANIELGTAEVRTYEFNSGGSLIDIDIFKVGDVH